MTWSRPLVLQRAINQGLGHVAPDWCWQDFRPQLEQAALLRAVYRNFEPAQWRSERERTDYRRGCSSLTLAGVPPGEVRFLDGAGRVSAGIARPRATRPRSAGRGRESLLGDATYTANFHPTRDETESPAAIGTLSNSLLPGSCRFAAASLPCRRRWTERSHDGRPPRGHHLARCLVATSDSAVATVPLAGNFSTTDAMLGTSGLCRRHPLLPHKRAALAHLQPPTTPDCWWNRAPSAA